MYQRILLPLDGSRLSEAAIPFAAQLGGGLGAQVTLLHVVTIQELAVTGRLTMVGPDGLNRFASEYLRDMEKAGRHYGAALDSRISSGAASVEIVREAEEGGYDLIAMATHGRSGLGRWAFGSTADRVLHTTKLPMLLVRPGEPSASPRPADGFQSLIVPLDGSALAEAALPAVEDLATRLGLEVILLRVVPTSGMLYAGVEPYSYDARMDEALWDTAEWYLNKVARDLRQKGMTVRWEQRIGYAAQHIVDFAESVAGGMVVMSTHGRSGVGRWALGSVADRVLQASKRPVLLLRSRPAGPAERQMDADVGLGTSVSSQGIAEKENRERASREQATA